MSRKHFEAIAETLDIQRREIIGRYLPDVERDAKLFTLCRTTQLLASEFRNFNPHFNAERFISACGF